jgi:hypothetical protein
VFPVAVVGLLIGRSKVGQANSYNAGLVFVFLFYSCVVTIIQWILDYYNGWSRVGMLLGWGEAQTIYRYPIQLVTFVWVWGLSLVGLWYVDTEKTLNYVINGYITGNLISISVGIYQVLSSYYNLPWVSGLNYTRFLTADLAERSMVVVKSLSLSLPRLYGLGGEPKHTASFAAIALVLMLSLFLDGKTSIVPRIRLKFVIILVGMIATASSGAWIGLVVIVVYYLIVSVSVNPRFVIVIASVVSIVLLSIVGIIGFEAAMTIYDQRVISRIVDINSLMLFEPKDAAFILYARDNINTLIFGHGTGGIDFRLVPYTLPIFLEYKSTLTPAYLLTRMLAEIGIVGIFLFALVWFQWLKLLRQGKDNKGVYFVVAGGLTMLVVTQVALAGYLLICSSLVAVHKSKTSIVVRQSKVDENDIVAVRL